MGLFRRLVGMTVLGAVDSRFDEQRTRTCIRPTCAAVTVQNGVARAARDQGTRAHIAELQIRAATSAGYVTRMGSTDPVVRAAAYADWNDESVDGVASARAVVRGRRVASAAAGQAAHSLSGGQRTDVDWPESMVADLAVLTRAIEDADVDLEAQVGAVAAAARSAITSYLGLTMTIHVDGQAVRVTARDPLGTQVATSLLIPLTCGSSAGTSPTLVLYAATPGAFVDLAADVGYALGLSRCALVFDQHLSELSERSGVTGRATQSAVNQAIGVLLDRGNTAEAAYEQLRRSAVSTGDEIRIVAEQVLLGAMR